MADAVPQFARRQRLGDLAVVRWVKCQGSSAATASRKSFDTRTELFEFCPATVR